MADLTTAQASTSTSEPITGRAVARNPDGASLAGSCFV
jgi:hypothetical protein